MDIEPKGMMEIIDKSPEIGDLSAVNVACEPLTLRSYESKARESSNVHDKMHVIETTIRIMNNILNET